MKYWKIFMTAAVIISISAGWVYATGNLPGTVNTACDASARIFAVAPQAAAATTELCGKSWVLLRKTGLPVPLSYNEKLIKILEIQCETDRICREIMKTAL